MTTPYDNPYDNQSTEVLFKRCMCTRNFRYTQLGDTAATTSKAYVEYGVLWPEP